MDQISKTIKYTSLLNIYGKILSKRQFDILDKYFNFNLSISEISIDLKISRSAVEDAIKNGCKNLDNFEKKLNLLKKNDELIKKLKKINSSNKDIDEIIKYIQGGN